jgi:hypothetical protein
LTSLVRHAHLSLNATLTVTFTLRFYIGQARSPRPAHSKQHQVLADFFAGILIKAERS